MLIRLSNRVPLARLNPASFRFYVLAMCVFWLLFWYLAETVQLARDQTEADTILVPYARSALPDENPDPERLVIHVLKEGKVLISDHECTDEDLKDVLLIEARVTREEDAFSARRVMIRADERTPFKHVMKIINWCRDPKVRIYRLSFGTRAEP